jgi:hypothetical protein
VTTKTELIGGGSRVSSTVDIRGNEKNEEPCRAGKRHTDTGKKKAAGGREMAQMGSSFPSASEKLWSSPKFFRPQKYYGFNKTMV